MGKSRKLHEVSLTEDTRYQGPLSYQGFQVLGWLCLVLLVAKSMMNLAVNADKSLEADLDMPIQILDFFSSLSLPFLLIANFARILHNAEGYKVQMLRNGGGALGILLASLFLYKRYAVGFVDLAIGNAGVAEMRLMDIVRTILTDHFIAFNIFIDLFLCTLFMYFLNARPKRVFTGKKVIIFRMMAILPVAYEIASMVLKGLAFYGTVELPFWSFPLLTVKPPMTFVVFMILAIHMKARERRFCKHGRSLEEYQAFLKTNRNSRHFSVFLCILLIVTAIVDVVSLVLQAAFAAGVNNTVEEEELIRFLSAGEAMGFGKAVPQLFMAPLVLLFSYSREPRLDKRFSTVIPMIGIALMGLVVLEGSYQAAAALAERHHITELGWFDENPSEFVSYVTDEDDGTITVYEGGDFDMPQLGGETEAEEGTETVLPWGMH